MGALPTRVKAPSASPTIRSPRLTWKFPRPPWKTWFHLQRPSASFHVSLRESTAHELLFMDWGLVKVFSLWAGSKSESVLLARLMLNGKTFASRIVQLCRSDFPEHKRRYRHKPPPNINVQDSTLKPNTQSQIKPHEKTCNNQTQHAQKTNNPPELRRANRSIELRLGPPSVG